MSQADQTAYNTESPEREKWLQLRAKTDRQLLNIIHARLEAGLYFAAKQSLECAQQAFTEAQNLLPVLSDPPRHALESRLTELRKALERLSQNRELCQRRTAASGL
jgi:hypothetical protein